jgi:predicted HAD superfamily Cof-like phosphohydrolase
MTPNMFKDVAVFHEKFEQGYDGPPRKLDEKEEKFRIHFLEEEVTECKDAVTHARPDLHLDALVDICFVAMGTAYKHGWDFNEAWRRVVQANMNKVLAPEGKWKIQKPPFWLPPDHTDLV